MVSIEPFRGIRYVLTRAGNPSDLLAAPLHRMNREAIERHCSRNPHNVAHLARAAEADPTSEGSVVPGTATTRLKRWLEDGVLRQEREPSLYLYEQSFMAGGLRRTRRGVIGLAAVARGDEQSVTSYTRCSPDERAQAERFIRNARVHVMPVPLMVADPDDALDRLLARSPSVFPDLAMSGDDGSEHRLFCLSDPSEIGEIADLLDGVVPLVADHQALWEAALASAPVDEHPPSAKGGRASPGGLRRVLAYFCSASNPLAVLSPYHLIIRGLADFSVPAFVKRLREYFDVQRISSLRQAEHLCTLLRSAAGRERAAFVIVGSDATGRRSGYLALLDPRLAGARLARIPGYPERTPVDVVVFEELILRDLLGIMPETPQGAAHLVHGTDPQRLLVEGRGRDIQLVVLMNELPVSTLEAVGRAGRRLPDRSAHFTPAPLAGLVLHEVAGSP